MVWPSFRATTALPFRPDLVPCQRPIRRFLDGKRIIWTSATSTLKARWTACFISLLVADFATTKSVVVIGLAAGALLADMEILEHRRADGDLGPKASLWTGATDSSDATGFRALGALGSFLPFFLNRLNAMVYLFFNGNDFSIASMAALVAMMNG